MFHDPTVTFLFLFLNQCFLHIFRVLSIHSDPCQGLDKCSTHLKLNIAIAVPAGQKVTLSHLSFVLEYHIWTYRMRSMSRIAKLYRIFKALWFYSRVTAYKSLAVRLHLRWWAAQQWDRGRGNNSPNLTNGTRIGNQWTPGEMLQDYKIAKNMKCKAKKTISLLNKQKHC